jgi:hypothetical protein
LKILAIECSSGRGSIAVTECDRTVFSLDFENPRGRGVKFFAALENAVSRCGDFAQILVGTGPGSYNSLRASIATAVIGGISVSTVLSLVIVPSFFLIMDDLSSLLARIFGRFIGRKEDEPVEPAAHELAAQIETRAIEIALLNARVGSLEEVAANRRGPKALHVAE